jgi:hypothetical protein
MQNEETQEAVAEETKEVEQAPVVLVPLTGDFPEIPETKMTVLASMTITQRVFSEVEKLRGLTLSSLEDSKGYKLLSSGRKFVKDMRVQAIKACKEGRKPLKKEQDEWIELEKKLEEWFNGIEKPLEAQEEAYEAEQSRKKAEIQKALAQRTERRLITLNEIMAPVDLESCQTLSDVQWDEYLAPLKAKYDLRMVGKKRLELLAEVDSIIETGEEHGNWDICAALTVKEFEKLLEDARIAWTEKKDREAAEALEASRLAEEQRLQVERDMKELNDLRLAKIKRDEEDARAAALAKEIKEEEELNLRKQREAEKPAEEAFLQAERTAEEIAKYHQKSENADQADVSRYFVEAGPFSEPENFTPVPSAHATPRTAIPAVQNMNGPAIIMWAMGLQREIGSAPAIKESKLAEYTSYLTMLKDTVEDIITLVNEGE